MHALSRWTAAAGLALALVPGAGYAARTDSPVRGAEAQMTIRIENAFSLYEIGAGGENLRLLDKRTGADYCAHTPTSSFARVKVGGEYHDAAEASLRDGRNSVRFAGCDVRAVVEARAEEHCFVFEVVSVAGGDVQEFAFLNVPLTLKGVSDEPFACCALALNLQTNVRDLPGPSSRLWAACYPKFGFAGAKAAVVACPQDRLRAVMQEVVAAAEDLPHSPLGGPWALEPEVNYGSYLFNFSGLSEKTVDDWTNLAQTLGFDEIDFHTGTSLRFGDCRPDPDTYPNGFASVKAVIDRLHAAGIRAGLHTYAFFIAKDCPWVTPTPDPRLASDATFTLAQPLTADETLLPVVEPTTEMSPITGFFVRNSATLRIEDELIVFAGVSKDPPFAFTRCERGAHGTRAASHPAGAQVHHLKECFGLFVPDVESTLFAEVAARTAQAFNECGFDMIYLDALDGEDILGGRDCGWHYGSKFVFELWERLERPAVMEMSTFHHHLWFVRSRLGAWDFPARGHKWFIDVHCAANEDNRRIFLPSQLGWWSVKTWSGPLREPTFSDDIEYLCCKALGTDSGLSLMGVDPKTIETAPAFRRLAAIFRRYLTLRRAGPLPASIKARLSTPREEFTLVEGDGRWHFRPAHYAEHKVHGLDGWSNAWSTHNPFERQPVRLRIEALMAAGPYDAPDNLVLADFSDAECFSDRAAEPGIEADLRASDAQVKVGAVSGCFTAASSREERDGSWANAVRTFAEPVDMSKHEALGLWVYGDGQGEVLNLQLRSPEYVGPGLLDHYLTVDFTGWRYFELIEPEGERFADYRWPYGRAAHICHLPVHLGQVATLGLWYNDLRPGKTTCYLSPIKALPVRETTLDNPSVAVGGRTITFPVEIPSGGYLEFNSMSDCTLYGPRGEVVSRVQPRGEVPVLEPGDNAARFDCDAPAGVSARARVTIISQGEPLGE